MNKKSMRVILIISIILIVMGIGLLLLENKKTQEKNSKELKMTTKTELLKENQEYEVGKDIESGSYTIEAISGSGEFIVKKDSKRDRYYLNKESNNRGKYENGVWRPYNKISSVVLLDGYIIKTEKGLEVKLTKFITK